MCLIKKPTELKRNNMILDILEINAKTHLYKDENLKHSLECHGDDWLNAAHELEMHIYRQGGNRNVTSR